MEKEIFNVLVCKYKTGHGDGGGGGGWGVGGDYENKEKGIDTEGWVGVREFIRI